MLLSEKQFVWVREQLDGVKIGNLDALAIWMPTIEDLGNTYKDFWGRTRRFVAFARWASETGHPLNGQILSDYADSLSVSESSKAVYLSWIRCILRRCVSVPESAFAPRKSRRAKKQAEPKAKESCSLVRVATAAVQDTKPKRRNFTKTFLFELFDIKPGFDEHDLKRGYHKAAMQYHPDHGGRASQFRAVEEAYRWLADTRGIPGHRGWVYAAYADARYDLDMPEIDAVVKGFYQQIICESAAV